MDGRHGAISQIYGGHHEEANAALREEMRQAPCRMPWQVRGISDIRQGQRAISGRRASEVPHIAGAPPGQEQLRPQMHALHIQATVNIKSPMEG